MWIQRCIKSLTSMTQRQPVRRRPATSRLRMESLEDRRVLSYSPIGIYPVGLTPVATVAGDFDNDGHSDLVAANRGDNTVSVLLNDGNAAFPAALVSGTGRRPVVVLAGDLNGDENADVLTVNIWDEFGYGGNLSVLLGNGNGLFQAPHHIELPAQTPLDDLGPLSQTPFSAALGDLNADGRLDLSVGGRTMRSIVIGFDGDTGNPIYETRINGYLNVLLGNGDGTFGQATAYHLGSSVPRNVAVGDFDGNGRLDVITDAGGLTTLLGNGDGTLQTPRASAGSGYYAVGGGSLPLADFDGDEVLDVLMRDATDHALIVMLGNGDGAFRQTEPVLVTALHAAIVGDVNVDGNSDVVVLTSNYDENDEWTSSAIILLGSGDGKFATPLNSDLALSPGTYFNSAVIADFDGDALPDLTGAAFEHDYGYGIDFQGFIAMAQNDGNWILPSPASPIINILDLIVNEGNTGTRAATFTVTLSKVYGQPVQVAYATINGTATAGSDYQAASGTLVIPAGQTSGTITVLVNGDRFAERSETFFLNLNSAVNATIADGQGQGNIVDDEPRISIGDVSKSEGKKNQTTLFTFTVTLSAAYDQPVTMSFQTVNGTATTNDGDYIAKAGTLTFKPGETMKTITIEVKGDSKKEAHESFFVDLYNSSVNSLFTKKRGLATILNDD